MKLKLNDSVYEIIKWIVVIFLPALNGFVYALGHALGFDSTVVCEVITAVHIFLGALIGVSTINYNKDKGKEDNADEDKYT